MDIEKISNGENSLATERPRNENPSSVVSTHTNAPRDQLQELHLNIFEPADSSNGPHRLRPALSGGTLATSSTPILHTEANANQEPAETPDNEMAHEIGLIPLSTGVSKYVGPSSGFSFAKLVFARVDQASPGTSHTITSHESPSTKRSRSVFTIEPTGIPTSVNQAIQLSKIYFEHVHVQYPFLHEPSHYQLINDLYGGYQNASAVALFQVTMVLAISAVILSKRLRIPFTGEGLCAMAMESVDKVDFQNSTSGVQCLLLISMFTLHSSFLAVNPWYLNYQCLAAVLDLGLQRNVPISPSVSAFEREMRTRIFWVIYSIDRTLATTLGRPIGLRDEACDLRVGTFSSPFPSLRNKDSRAGCHGLSGVLQSSHMFTDLAHSCPQDRKIVKLVPTLGLCARYISFQEFLGPCLAR